MWTFNTDQNKWIGTNDSLAVDNFNFLKQELSALRFYSKCLSGATYLPVNDLQNIYDVLSSWKSKSPYLNNPISSPYSNSLIPSLDPEIISPTASEDYYTKFLSDYGLTLKNLFTPNKLIKDSIDNFLYVDVATTEAIDINLVSSSLIIDGVRVLEGHLVLVKNNVTFITLSSLIDPNTYFQGQYTVIQNLGATIEYSFLNEENGVYVFRSGQLIRDDRFNDYENCKKLSLSVKLGTENTGRQFHLNRLSSGYFPVNGEIMQFTEKKNWILRNRVDYNNLFEINYYDVIKYSSETYFFEGVTYSIPERELAVGEFGTILNTQGGISNLIQNKYKVNLRSISKTSIYYWICGDDGVLLRVRKHDFKIDRIQVDCLCPRKLVTTDLKSISFFDDQRGVTVGELNTILITSNSGVSWQRLRLADFDSFYYNKVIYTDLNRFYVCGNSGVFLEFIEGISGWRVNRLRISRFIDDDDEYLLMDHIRDIRRFTTSSWNPTFSYGTQSTSNPKDLIILSCDFNKVFIYDRSGSIPNFDFVSLDIGGNDYGDINAITPITGSSSFLFSGTNPQTGNPAIMSFNLEDFTSIGVGNSFSNTISGPSASVIVDDIFVNNIFDFNAQQTYICGNESLLKSATSSYNFQTLDSTFEEKLKSKLLFLDYDIGSKLNFFTDDGDYRLPESVTFSSATFSGPSYFSFSPIVISATAPSFLTQSQIGWIDYWRDREKTFRFYDTVAPVTDISSVSMSLTFSWTSNQSQFTISATNITASASNIINLAPNILIEGASRYSGLGLTAISAPASIFDIYIYDYLLVWRNNTINVNPGDLIRLQSAIVDTNLMVNRVEILGGNTYHWMFTDFNSNIIRGLDSGTVSLTHLNSYNTVGELIDRFSLHSYSTAYSLTQSSGVVEVQANFNNLTSYYNLSTNINVSGDLKQMSYTSGFLKFGYLPTYNLLDYLEGINEQNNPNPVFRADKTYYAMPDLRGIPLGSLTSSVVYIDTNGLTYSQPAKSGNRLYFGTDLKLEWQSIFINTFVDVNIYGSTTYSNTALLVMDKWFDPVNDAYVLEFHKNVIDNPAFIGDSNVLLGGTLDIISRRTLLEISNDLQQLNTLSRPLRQKQWTAGSSASQWNVDFSAYESDLNFKPNTDSYAKILLSDSETVQSLTGLIYTDYKNELALNITRLGEEFSIPIINTANYIVGTNSYLYISCSQKHNLITGQGAVLEFNGGTGSSQEINQQYFGYQIVTVVNDYNFYVDIPYGNIPLVGNDVGVVKFTKQDPFFNYQPVDLIDLGVDGRGKIAIELSIENSRLVGKTYSLVDVDFSKFRFRLIDGLNIENVALSFPWLLEAEISGAVIGFDENGPVWYLGTWECGRWFSGTWISGSWLSGDWYGGVWRSLNVKDNWLSVDVDDKSSNTLSSTWFGGRWFDGTWENGTWVDGRWYGGIWNAGLWYRGIWNDGTWNDGKFLGGIWVLGTWNRGIFNTDNEPSFWLDGKWYGGDFENGIWYNGLWEEKNTLARFGVNAFNSRTATWNAGKWISGSFYSRININDSGQADVSDVHKYSIWKTGLWTSGNFYGGIAYNMDFKSGTWWGGILDDIQVIGFDAVDNYFVVNGIFKFNIGDEITIIDNNESTPNSIYGSNDNPLKYRVLYTVEDTVNKWTNIYVDYNITSTVNAPVNTGLRVVSRFKNVNWKSGIWTNGIYESGLWQGGIWYNGVFFGDWM
jgi:hypothetical protein